MMKERYLNKGIILVPVGICFVLAALRDKSGRIAYLSGLFIICISEVVFSVLGKTGMIIDHKIIVWYLFGLFIIQIVIGTVVYHQLRKRY